VTAVRELTYLQAVREAIHEEMARDPDVIVMGQDLRANVYGASAGLAEEFGDERVRDLPTSETACVGAAAGAAMTGLRPVVDMTIASFVYVAMDQFVSQVAKDRYMHGPHLSIPVVYRATMFFHGATAAQHSDRPYPTFMQVPGLKIVVPATPADAKGLLKAAIRDDDPVMCFEDSFLWRRRGPVPAGDHVVPLGRAEVKREGSDVTVVAIGRAVLQALEAAETLAREAVSVEVVDPRSLAPLDWDTILGSIEKTGRLVVADPAVKTCSAASEIAATAAEEAFASLRAPVRRVTTPDVHTPFSPALEADLYPSAATIAAAVRETAGEAARAH
jgi:pyruvate dehydrogenase E1 component beta subunit